MAAYTEAGTPAGDPVEAEAISTAFFGTSSNYSRESPCEPPLFVGSIKTVIGHTEGTAGLAAVMKASLALQNATIPPNMLLNELNPTVAPFYKDLEISLEAQKWPTFSGSLTRRVSVNSFGFGGANAHAILESWDPDCNNTNISADRLSLLPFNFSASSNTSLLSSLAAYSAYLNTNHELNLRDLSYTLNCRRSTLPFRISITAANMENLIDKLQSFSNTPPQTLSPSIQSSLSGKPKILGIFTGQGAQWAGMGADLLTSYPFAKKCIDDLDNALQSLSEQDRPNWSLYSEILKDTTSSRIGEALFSQSLCTAIQILLVDLVHAAGIQFNTVVGHSSGEIAAAYAAGYLSSNDAIKIAYYRGLSLHHADRGSRVRGAMMVAGTSFEDAEELCKMPSLQDRICVAASNSSQSVTLSGDVDAVHEAMDIFEDEGKFNRLLKVDKAYHSNHMLPCAAPYVESMQKSQIKPLSISEPQTRWISSVYARDIADVKDSLADLYWSNNMTKPVLFSQAVSFASGARGPFDMAIEIGPHPALKGPALGTILEISGQEVPYSGSLARGMSGADGVSSLLGSVWSALGSGVINYKQFDSEVTPGRSAPTLLKNLPNYQWDHDRIYWHESRASALFRGGSGKFHPLLGTRCPDGTSKEIRWRNYLHTREIPWLAHHQVQGQIVFPAAGYISAATELIADQYGLNSIQIIDFQEIVIGQALTLEENSGTEVIFSFAIISDLDKVVTATFNCYSNSSKGSSSPVLHASARVDIILGSPKSHSLPPVTRDGDSFLDLDAKRFYDHVTDIGFGYTGPFVALSMLRRRMNEAAGAITVPDEDENSQPLIVHPASLDGAIQSIMLAYSFPGDGRLRSLHLPTRIDRIRLNPTACQLNSQPSASLPFFSSVTDGKFAELSGDVEIQTCDGRYAMLQLEGLHTTPLSPLSAATDIPMFTEITWGLEIPSNSDPALSPKQASQQSAIFLDIERVALFYLKKLADHTEFAFPISIEHRTLQSYAQDCVSRIKSGANECVPVEWLNDTEEDISAILNRQVFLSSFYLASEC